MTKKRTNYYQGLSADYSTPVSVAPDLASRLIEEARVYMTKKEPDLPAICNGYSLEQIEQENKQWWPTHCEALRQGRADILTAEYRDDLVYFCQDGPYYGLDEQKSREEHWWALLAQPGVTMASPIVMFHGEFVWFEWNCVAKRSPRGACRGSAAGIAVAVTSKANS